ncbi:MAG TPA: hypothetical protein VHZ06_00055, partial [Marmoricola sp.]|nr:hypothetical protein [Marmoricola sp.]
REYMRHTAVRRPDQLTTHHHGEADHLAWLERPFAEALRAQRARPSVVRPTPECQTPGLELNF